MAVDVTYVCDGGEFVWLEGKKYRCLKNAQDILHSCTSNKYYLKRTVWIIINSFIK